MAFEREILNLLQRQVHCRHVSGEPQPLESDEVRWVRLDEIDQFPFPKANVKIIEALRQSPNSSFQPLSKLPLDRG
jgi:hypothetical protein